MTKEKFKDTGPSRKNIFNISSDDMVRLLIKRVPEFETSAKRIRRYRYLKIVLLAYFVIFMISGYFGEIYINRGLFPVAIFYTIENSLFPVNTYVFWIITPFVMIIAFVLMLCMLWGSEDFERFLIRRKNVKKLPLACLSVPIMYLGMIYNQNPSGIMNSILQPLKHKIVFFLLYGGGAAVLIPLAFALFVVDLRARLIKNH